MSTESLLSALETKRLVEDQRKRKLGLAKRYTRESLNAYINELLKEDKLSTEVFEEYNVDFCWCCGNKFDGRYYSHRITLEHVRSKKVSPIMREITTKIKDVTVNECLDCHKYRTNLQEKIKTRIKYLTAIIISAFLLIICIGYIFFNWDWTHLLSGLVVTILAIGFVWQIGPSIFNVILDKRSKIPSKYRRDRDIPIVANYIKGLKPKIRCIC